MANSQKTRGAVLVTGATGGMGQVLCPALVKAGFDVYAVSRSAADSGSSGRIRPVEMNLTDDSSITQGLARVAGEVGDRGLAGLINMAGLIVGGPLELVSPDDMRDQFALNVLAPHVLTRASLPLLRKGRGRVVNIGAVSARVTVPYFGAISASKAALASLSDAMRMEFAPQGIRVVLIEPGAIETGIFATAAERQARMLKAQAPERVAYYQARMAAMAEAFATMRPDKPKIVVDAVLKALSQADPQPRVLAGRSARQLGMLRFLPTRMRDWVITASLGITGALTK